MLPGILAGAGLLALLDAFLQIPVPAAGFGREYLLIVVAGTLSTAIIFWALSFVGTRLPGAGGFFQRRHQTSQGFWIGIAIGMTPFCLYWLPPNASAVPAMKAVVRLLWATPPLLVYLLAPRFFSRGAPTLAALKCIAGLAPLAWLIAFLIPAKDMTAEIVRPHFAENMAASSRVVSKDSPDIILVSIDTLRADFEHDGRSTLPILSELADVGITSDYALSSSNQTVPAHVTMLTGLSAVQHGLRSNLEQPTESMPFLAKVLQGAGWRTAGVISNALLASSFGFGAGFDVYDDSVVSSIGPADRFVVQAVPRTWAFMLLRPRPAKDFVRNWFGIRNQASRMPPGMGQATWASAENYLSSIHQQSAPGFLFAHFMDPHDPYTPPMATAGKWFSIQGVEEKFQAYSLGGHDQLRMIQENLSSSGVSALTLQSMRDLYDEEVFFLDGILRQLVQKIERGKRPTALIITSDHGEHFGEWKKMLHSNSLQEALVRVPFVFVGLNGFSAPQKHLPYAVHLQDIVPTILSLAGLPQGGLKGRNILDGLWEDSPHFTRWTSHLAVRKGSWKLHARLDGEAAHSISLFDLIADPQEKNNQLSAAPKEAPLRELESLAKKFAEADALFERSSAENSAERMAKLKELGYVD